jgi:hypothetical protein
VRLVPPVSRHSRPTLCVWARLLAPSLAPIEPAVRHGRATSPVPTGVGPLPIGRHPPVEWDRPRLCPSLSLPSSAVWCRLIDHPPPPRAGIKRSGHRVPRPISFLLLSLFFPGRASTLTPPQLPCPPPTTGGLRPTPDFARTALPSAFAGERLPEPPSF